MGKYDVFVVIVNWGGGKCIYRRQNADSANIILGVKEAFSDYVFQYCVASNYLSLIHLRIRIYIALK